MVFIYVLKWCGLIKREVNFQIRYNVFTTKPNIERK